MADNTRLSTLTTIGVGGPARQLIRASSTEQLIESTIEVWASGQDWLLLGGGSNLVVADEGFDGTVIRVETRGIERLESSDGSVRLRVQAGEPWDALVVHTVERGWSGLEALSGIPGSSGAAPIQNIGAYGQELSASLIAIEYLDYLRGELLRVPAAELELGYRTSAMKRGRQGLVVSIELELAASADALSQPIAYPQLAAAMGAKLGDRVALADVRSGVLALRAAKGMVLDPNDPDSVSCGSFFTNPVVTENFARSLPAEAPRWPIEPELADVAVPIGGEPAPRLFPTNTRVKLSAAWLIEHAGITRGFALPGSRAAISSRHTLAIVNRGGASAAEIAELARYAQTRVLSEFGVRLQPEPMLVGLEL